MLHHGDHRVDKLRNVFRINGQPRFGRCEHRPRADLRLNDGKAARHRFNIHDAERLCAARQDKDLVFAHFPRALLAGDAPREAKSVAQIVPLYQLRVILLLILAAAHGETCVRVSLMHGVERFQQNVEPLFIEHAAHGDKAERFAGIAAQTAFKKAVAYHIGNDLNVLVRTVGPDVLAQSGAYGENSVAGVKVSADLPQLPFREHVPLEPCRVFRADERDAQLGAQGLSVAKSIKGMGVDDLRRTVLQFRTEKAQHLAQEREICQVKPHRLCVDAKLRHIPADGFFRIYVLRCVRKDGEHADAVAVVGERLRLFAEKTAADRIFRRRIPRRDNQNMHSPAPYFFFFLSESSRTTCSTRCVQSPLRKSASSAFFA